MKNYDIAAEMDKILNSEENKKLYSNAAAIEKNAFRKVSDQDKPTELEVEVLEELSKQEAAIPQTKTASAPMTKEAELEIKTSNMVDSLLKISSDLDAIGFEKLAAVSILLADKIVAEAKAKKDSKKSPKKKMDVKERMKKMREMKGKGKSEKSKSSEKSSKKSTENKSEKK
jgi:hypothetical protein